MAAAEIVSQLNSIWWLLAAICVGVFVIAAVFFFLAVNMVGVMRENRQANMSSNKHLELEALLASGQSAAAKFAAMDWIALEPKRPEAHWALAKAHHQLGELAEAKQALSTLLRVAPEEQYRVDAWLKMLETDFAQKRPRPVS
ncbi:tetratricopeptide repeat protein [uncultured Xanthomonas sp.]|uniref:tetratricopeptide repeat protein n=1 Tax=uncultured Xanthomonas sp. TaxID=152831 RepID=UPI0025CDCE7B|nr:tetratricopeptide repeat protein [uncultured Xanthomonas sp.]